MDINVQRDGTAAHVTVGGDIDAETAPVLAARIDELVASGIEEVTVDPGEVSFLSSAGLSVLITSHQRCRVFRLLRGNRLVDRLVDLTGLEVLYGADV